MKAECIDNLIWQKQSMTMCFHYNWIIMHAATVMAGSLVNPVDMGDLGQLPIASCRDFRDSMPNALSANTGVERSKSGARRQRGLTYHHTPENSSSEQIGNSFSRERHKATAKQSMGTTDRPPASRLQGKVAIVTAATAGIGLAIAARLGKEGAKVVISSRRKDNVDEALRQLKQQGVDCCGCVCHVGSRDHLKQLVQLTLDTYGKIDILISNAAVNPASGPVLQTPDAAIDKILEINVRSPIILTKEVAPHLKPGSTIVYISSYTAFNPSPPIPVYAISKTALLGLTKALAEELGPKGIRVNCIAPGDLHQVWPL